MNALQPTPLHVPGSRPPALAVDPDLRLLVPADDVASPELSIVVPALNEQLTIGEFVDWCKEGLRKAKVAGEILIVDSSTDSTAEIALSNGARVLNTPNQWLRPADLH